MSDTPSPKVTPINCSAADARWVIRINAATLARVAEALARMERPEDGYQLSRVIDQLSAEIQTQQGRLVSRR